MSEVKEVTYSQLHRINMGDFESLQVTASITLAPTHDAETAEDLLEEARNIISDHLEADLDRSITATAQEETYVETWLDGPRRRSKRSRSR